MTGIRPALALAITILLVGAGATASLAVWNAQVSKTATAAPGSLDFQVTGVDALTNNYKTTSLVKTAVVTITNSGTVPLQYSMALTGNSGTLASQIGMSIWKQNTNCITQPAAPNSTVGTLAAPPALPATANSGNVGDTLTLCIRTTLNGDHATLLNTSVSPTMKITGTVGTNWSVTKSNTFTQAVTHIWYQIKNAGLCAQANGLGAAITVATCSDPAVIDNQAWRFVPVASGYQISGTVDGQIWCGLPGNKKNVSLGTCVDSLGYWTRTASGASEIITNVGNDFALDIDSSSLKLIQWANPESFVLVEIP